MNHGPRLPGYAGANRDTKPKAVFRSLHGWFHGWLSLDADPRSMSLRKGPQGESPSAFGSPSFIHISKPGDGSWRSSVRSQAATARHAAARRRRLLQYQQEAENSEPRDTRDHMCLYASPESLCEIRGVDPFDTLARPTTRFECFLMDHYVKYLVVNAKICNDAADEVYDRTGSRMQWVQVSFADKALLSSIFLSACRSFVQLKARGDFYERALEYRDVCIQSVNHAISREVATAPSMTTIATIIALALDARFFDDILVAKKHCDAADVMIQIKAGATGGEPTDPMLLWSKLLLIQSLEHSNFSANTFGGRQQKSDSDVQDDDEPQQVQRHIECLRLSRAFSVDLCGNLVIVNKWTKAVRSNTWLAQPSDETGPNRWLGVFSDFHAMDLFLDFWLSLRASLKTDDPAFIYTMLVLPHQTDPENAPPKGVSNPVLFGIRHSWLAFPPENVPKYYRPNSSRITIILFDYSHNVSLRLNRMSIPDPTLPILPFHRSSRLRINPGGENFRSKPGCVLLLIRQTGEYTDNLECMYWVLNGLPAWRYIRPTYDRHAHIDDRLKEWIGSALSSRGVPNDLPAWTHPGLDQPARFPDAQRTFGFRYY
ncbi:hypothetical protein SUNI508_11780 [Seiridium unicorne]|uniref:Uncharacterized protein n=1 Tax=Seiridium unicorne TaxID=138068 RepID=A0ABR2UH18_9PEZI